VKEAPPESKRKSLLALTSGYGLILATLWTEKQLQRELYWLTAIYFAVAAVLSLRNKPLGFPRLSFTLVVVGAGALVAGLVMWTGAALGTLHGLFGIHNAVFHASSYIVWTVIQQYLQQDFFFLRIEQFTRRGALASLITAGLFGIAHLPNPVLTPITFVGGFILSELFRRYRSFVPLGIAQGLVGLALAVSVPDQAMHHMRVGLGYLRYRR
jgi:Type II CAAX prenyl endopeptidase Rce1-like